MAGISLIHTHKKNRHIFNCMFGLIVCLFVFSNIVAELMFLHCFCLQINLETTCLAVHLVLINSGAENELWNADFCEYRRNVRFPCE